MSLEAIAERARELAVILGAADAPGAGSGLGGAQLLDAVARVGELRRLIDAVGVDLAGRLEWMRDQDPESAKRLGEKSPAMVLQGYAGLDAGEAHAWCRVGASLHPRANLQGEVLPPEREALAAAVADGRMRIAGAARVLETIEHIAPYASHADCERVERFLIDEAALLTDRQFARLCRAIPGRFAPEDAEAREEYLRRRSGVVVRTAPDGLVTWTVTMHPEAAGFLTAAVDARTAPRRQPRFVDLDAGPDSPHADEADPRTRAQQRLDALVSIARESLAHDSGHMAGASVTMVVTVGLDELRSGLGAARITGVDEPISAATARRLAADAGIIPAVLGGASEELDLGREVRLATEAQRRALEQRDGGCVWWSCTAPPGWCEVAHIVPWADGGGTDLSNMVLLCPFHHRRFDRDGWELEHRDGERFLIPPPWVDAARTPRRAAPSRALVTA